MDTDNVSDSTRMDAALDASAAVVVHHPMVVLALAELRAPYAT